MSKGILVFAHNNSEIDYVKQAAFLAKRAEQYLSIPVSIVTDKQSINDRYKDVFDKIIINDITVESSKKYFYNSAKTHKVLDFKNDDRVLAFDLSPYDETIVLDSDYVIADSILKNAYDSAYDFLIYKDAIDLASRDTSEFKFISETSVDFYWATCVFFRKTPENKIFFDLIQHIKENWQHYNSVFQLNRTVYRNDHAFSIAIHIMNGRQEGSFAGKMPGKLFYTTDKDILCDVQGESFLFLVEKENHLGEYTPIRFKDNTVHVMNKFSLNRFIDKELAND